MRTFFPILLISFWLYQCTSSETSQEQANEIAIDSVVSSNNNNTEAISLVEIKRSNVDLKAIVARTAAFKKQFGAFHEHIPYLMFVEEQLYFIVAKGDWKDDHWESDYSEDRKEAAAAIGTYQVGLVNELNEVIIPTQYDKIYNIGSTAPNLIEVEVKGKLGAYDILGNELLKAEFDGIYPYTNAKNAWVQVRKGTNFGWLSTSGKVSLDPNSHDNKGLFKAQPLANLLTNWSFDSQSETLIPIFKAQAILEDKYQTDPEGLLILPSYLYHLGLVPQFRTAWDASQNIAGNGTTTATIQTAHETGENQTIISAFSQYFSEPRGYFDEHSDIVTVNEQMEKIDLLSIETGIQSPCSGEIRFQFIDDNTLEAALIRSIEQSTYSSMTCYEYHRIGDDGKISPIEINGLYKFSRIVKMTDFYFKGCFSRYLTEDEMAIHSNEDDYINIVKTEHLSMEDLDVMRNEIYAAHGYKFKSKKWQDYFGNQAWYQPQFDNVDDQLTEIEKHNITAILNQKKKMDGHEAEFLNTTYEAFVLAG